MKNYIKYFLSASILAIPYLHADQAMGASDTAMATDSADKKKAFDFSKVDLSKADKENANDDANDPCASDSESDACKQSIPGGGDQPADASTQDSSAENSDSTESTDSSTTTTADAGPGTNID